MLEQPHIGIQLETKKVVQGKVETEEMAAIAYASTEECVFQLVGLLSVDSPVLEIAFPKVDSVCCAVQFRLAVVSVMFRVGLFRNTPYLRQECTETEVIILKFQVRHSEIPSHEPP